MLATYEALAGDAGALRAITWEALVLDDRGRPRAAVAKAAAALGELAGRWRLLLSHSQPSKARLIYMLLCTSYYSNDHVELLKEYGVGTLACRLRWAGLTGCWRLPLLRSTASKACMS